jgi:hypothetical protein
VICTLTARRLKPGTYEVFRQAWDPSGTNRDVLGQWIRVYHCRDVSDPDVVVSFGLFDGSVDELRDAQARLGRESQVDRVEPQIEAVLLDGSYEVVEELVPAEVF